MRLPVPRAQTALNLTAAALAIVTLAAASRPVTALCEQYLASHAGETA